MLININSGHYLAKTGAIGVEEVPEHLICNMFTYEVSGMLRDKGHTVINHIGPLSKKIKEANEYGCDFGIELHLDSMKDHIGEYSSILYHPKSQKGSGLAKYLCNSFNNIPIKTIIHPDKRRLAYLRWTTFPAVIAELFWINNPKQTKYWKQTKYFNKICKAVVAGVEEYVKSNN